MNKIFIDLLIIPSISIYSVLFFTNSYINMTYIIYKNNYIIIDYWFFLHILNTFILVSMYPYKITIKDYWKFVIIWEIIENIIIPNSLVKLNYFKEDIRDINGDIIAAIPASIYLIYK